MEWKIVKMSSKGQIVIPKEFRRDLKPGSIFLVTRINDKIIMKKLSFEKSVKKLERMMKKTLEIPKKTGLKVSDVKIALKKVRAKEI